MIASAITTTSASTFVCNGSPSPERSSPQDDSQAQYTIQKIAYQSRRKGAECLVRHRTPVQARATDPPQNHQPAPTCPTATACTQRIAPRRSSARTGTRSCFAGNHVGRPCEADVVEQSDHDVQVLTYIVDVSRPGAADELWWQVSDCATAAVVGVALDRLAADIEFDRGVPADPARQERCTYAAEIRYSDGSLLVSVSGEVRPTILAALLRRIASHVYQRATTPHPLIAAAEHLNRTQDPDEVRKPSRNPLLPKPVRLSRRSPGAVPSWPRHQRHCIY